MFGKDEFLGQDVVVQLSCEQAAVMYIYQGGAIRKVWIGDWR